MSMSLSTHILKLGSRVDDLISWNKKDSETGPIIDDVRETTTTTVYVYTVYMHA